MKSYDHKSIEPKWQKKWEEDNIYGTDDKKDNKTYLLVEFPYPSGDGLHNGHVRPYTGLDVVARKRRMQGENVLFPMGWDAFGLPTENFAIKTGIHPIEVTKKNTDNFRRQIKSLGISFDWDREINTTDPEYYTWTQWIFLRLYEKGLAYKAKMAVNWCVPCKVGLANEEVIDGNCERCGAQTEKREKEQWMLKITEYADRLHDDLDDVDYLERIKLGQRNWIGRSHGVELSFAIKDSDKKINVFTTRPDTLFGVTYMVLSPEHQLVQDLKDSIKNWDEVLRYIVNSGKKTEIERTREEKDLPAGEAGKTGVVLEGIKAINPANQEEIPVYIADYVLAHYGTGAIMAVPAHDERDYAFAEKYDLPIKQVITVENAKEEDFNKREGEWALVNAQPGKLINSGEFDGISSKLALSKITEKVGGEMKTTFKLRDWVFSRQRYWGEPIPMIYCEKCARLPDGQGWVPVPVTELPVKLPDVEKYQTNDEGESPLADIPEFVNTTCPKCGGPAKRETDTMPQWAGSSWYYLRYADPHNNKEFASQERLKDWSPVTWYNGGMEHTTLHLLYSRFWHKFLFDEGLVPTKEPYAKRTSHGLILAEDGEKMSKSKGNVINPDDVVEHVGADSLRVYEMFMGPFEQAIPWSTNNMTGSRRFLERVYGLSEKVGDSINEDTERLVHKTIQKVTDDIEAMKFNTAISSLMILLNEFEKNGASRDAYGVLLQLLAPFAPHVTEELWEGLGNTESIHSSKWPEYDETKIVDEKVTIVVQINGKVRDSFEAQAGLSKDEILEMAIKQPKVKEYVEGKNMAKTIHIPDKLLNIVV